MCIFIFNIFRTGFKKNLNRAGQSIRQKTGLTDKTMDPEFAEELEKFKILEKNIENLSKEAKGYQNAMKAINKSQVELIEAMSSFYNETTEDPSFKEYKKIIKQLEYSLKTDVDEDYSTTVVEPLARYCSFFPEVNEVIKRRQKKLLDYDNQRTKVQKLVDKPSDDPQKLILAEKELDVAREMYENLNNMLISELPKVNNLRVPYLDPTFETMIKSHLLLGQIGYEKLESIRYIFTSDNNGCGDDGLSNILQQMNDLTICGNI
ncbi:BAR adaptor protein Hob3 [Cunninghamella echinulata]|nr:BAR adaptor protein Hob3 [Cunninghamella echinulata]